MKHLNETVQQKGVVLQNTISSEADVTTGLYSNQSFQSAYWTFMEDSEYFSYIMQNPSLLFSPGYTAASGNTFT